MIGLAIPLMVAVVITMVVMAGMLMVKMMLVMMMVRMEVMGRHNCDDGYSKRNSNRVCAKHLLSMSQSLSSLCG